MPSACSYILLRIFILSPSFLFSSGFFFYEMALSLYLYHVKYIYIYIFFFFCFLFFFCFDRYYRISYRTYSTYRTLVLLASCSINARFLPAEGLPGYGRIQAPTCEVLSNSSNNRAVPFNGKFASIFPYKWKEPLLLKVVYCRRNNPVLLF